MSNKENKWRLEDDNGKPVAKSPQPEIKMTFNGKTIGTFQSLTMERQGDIYEMGSWQPMRYVHPGVEVNIVDTGAFYSETMVGWNTNTVGLEEPFRVRTETIEDLYPPIINMMEEQMDIYQERFRRRPEYLSMNRPAYRSYWMKFRRGYMRESNLVNEERFLGVDVICNPDQRLPIMALGNAAQEGIEGRLHYE